MIAPTLALAALAWLALLVATPVGPASLATVIYSVGAFICHQIPERSFHLGGFQLPVCARCLGIYAGFAVGGWIHLLPARPLASPWRRPTGSFAPRVFMAGALPTAVTLVLEWSGVWRGSNIVRAIAGVVFGISIALVVMSVLATLHYSGCEPRRPTGPSQPPHI